MVWHGYSLIFHEPSTINHSSKKVAVHHCSTATARGNDSHPDSGQVNLRHPNNMTYRCYLPVLTGFAGTRRTGPGLHRPSGAFPHSLYRPHAGFTPCYSGLQVILPWRTQGTATSPSSTAINTLTGDRTDCNRTIENGYSFPTLRSPLKRAPRACPPPPHGGYEEVDNVAAPVRAWNCGAITFSTGC